MDGRSSRVRPAQLTAYVDKSGNNMTVGGLKLPKSVTYSKVSGG